LAPVAFQAPHSFNYYDHRRHCAWCCFLLIALKFRKVTGSLLFHLLLLHFTRSLLFWYSAGPGSVDANMSPTLVTCGAALSEGGQCQEQATVTKTQYVYDRAPVVGGPAHYTLREAHYTAVCPTCGERQITEKF